jgi:anti-anti-sigma regulatory factor
VQGGLARSAAKEIGPNVSNTLFKSSSLPEISEAVVDCVLPAPEEHSAQAPAPIERVPDPSDAGAPLKITGEQTIRTADELHEALAQYLDRGLDVVVDLSEVNECDAAALQLIFALRQSAVQRKQRFHITAVSPAIAGTAAALGLDLEILRTVGRRATADGDCEAAGEDNGNAI